MLDDEDSNITVPTCLPLNRTRKYFQDNICLCSNSCCLSIREMKKKIMYFLLFHSCFSCILCCFTLNRQRVLTAWWSCLSLLKGDSFSLILHLVRGSYFFPGSIAANHISRVRSFIKFVTFFVVLVKWRLKLFLLLGQEFKEIITKGRDRGRQERQLPYFESVKNDLSFSPRFYSSAWL